MPTRADGVPRAGVTKVGLVANTLAPVPVSSVRAAARLAEVKDPREVALLPLEVIAPVRLAFVVTLDAVKAVAVPVILVPTRADGVPRAGVTKVGEVANTLAPVPVSSVRAVANCAEVKEPKELALPTEVTAPVRLAFVVTLDAVRFATAVVEATIKGAVPVTTVDCTVVNLPVVAVVAPIVVLFIVPLVTVRAFIDS